MEKGKYLRLQQEKRAREQAQYNYIAGTLWWVSICFTGFVGIIYLLSWATVLYSHGEFLVKNLFYGAILLVLFVFLVKKKMQKKHSPIPDGTPDPMVNHLEDETNDEGEIDVDLD